MSTTEAIITDWHDTRWPNSDGTSRDDRIVAAKLAEEAGEVCGALIKIHEGRSTEQDLADEIGDVLIVLSTIAGRRGWTLDRLRADRWAEVANR